MTKITLSTLTNLQNDITATNAINGNSNIITTAFDNTLSRDGTSPNQMMSNLDMNSQRIINLVKAVDPTEPVRLAEVGDAAAQATAAAASATSAASSATAASNSAVSASSSATAASTSATNAATSATNSANSATTSANNATVVMGDKYLFATSTTMADPGTGNLRFNNATPASVTAIAISALSAATGNPNIDAWIATWAQSSNAVKGNLYIRKIGTPATFAEYQITAVADNTTWLQLTVQAGVASGSWSAADQMSVQFSRAGDAGAGVVGGLAHQVALFAAPNTISSGITLTDGQLVVGQTGADPLARTMSGDASLAASGALTVTNSNLSTIKTPGTWKDFYTDGSSVVQTIALGAAGTSLVGNGVAAAPSYTAWATAGQYQANTPNAILSNNNIWSAATLVTLTDAPTIALDLSTGINFSVTLTANRTLGNATNPKVGQTGIIVVTQDAGGSKTLAYGGNYKFIGGTAPVLTTTGTKVDYLSYWVETSTRIWISVALNVS